MTPAHDIRIRAGTRHDLEQLAHHHYRDRPPATIARVLVADHPATGDPLAVLVVSRPVLNGPWRRSVWPDLTPGTDRRASAHRLNDTLRTISRVIVHPHARSRGIASRLVRAYLDRPITPRTEAISAMGVWSDFFRHAGMRPVPLPISRRDARLTERLARLQIQPWQLADPTGLLRSIDDPAPLDAALRAWAGESGATRPHRERPLIERLRLAARSIDAARHAFVCDTPPIARHPTRPDPRSDPHRPETRHAHDRPPDHPPGPTIPCRAPRVHPDRTPR